MIFKIFIGIKIYQMPRNKSNQGCAKTLHSKLQNIAEENV